MKSGHSELRKLKYMSLLALLFASLTVYAEERLEMEGTAIIGNQELPKVLYIVPWKQSELPGLDEPPLQSLINEALTPLDREVFRRQVIYHHALSAQVPIK